MEKGITMEIHYTNEDYDSHWFCGKQSCLFYLAALIESRWTPEEDEMGNPRFVADIKFIDDETNNHL